jgi:CRP/FNR family transcriptional regulator
MDPRSFLKQVPLFSRLSARDLVALALITKIRSVRQRETIFLKAEKGDAFYVVVRGRINIFSRSRMGKVKTFAFLEPRDFFGEMVLLGGEDRSAGAVAMVASELLIIRRADFKRLLLQQPEISFGLLRTLWERLSQADREIESLSFNSVLGRLAETLLDMGKRYGKKDPQGIRLDLDLTQRDLADRVGTAREVVSRVINRFIRTGCLKINGKCFTLTNPAKLKEWIY